MDTMSGTQRKDFSTEFSCPYSAGTDFEDAIAKARSLFADGDLEGAHELLSHLEKRFVRAARLFDLFGDVLLQRGFVKDGIRYKTLHEILKGTFKIAKEEADALESRMRGFSSPASVPDLDALATPEAGPDDVDQASGVPPAWSSELDEPDSSEDAGPLFPVTVAMGREFMRQGHYGRAVEVFDTLAQKNPDDPELHEALKRAGEMMRKKKLLGILQGWLENIENMKAKHPTES
jgi:hypothetical protein